LLGSRALTRLDAGEVAEAEPAPFVAVTITLTVEPTAPEISFNVGAAASEMLLQLAPDALHNCHWKL
jgi:hypothetical protein